VSKTCEICGFEDDALDDKEIVKQFQSHWFCDICVDCRFTSAVLNPTRYTEADAKIFAALANIYRVILRRESTKMG
jgi:hypothetical protein